jgi:hypothetical protein
LSPTETEFIFEMWGAGSGAGTVGGAQTITVGGAASAGIGYDPDLLLALQGLVRKIKRKKLRPQQVKKLNSRDAVQKLIDALLAVKAVKAIRYLDTG